MDATATGTRQTARPSGRRKRHWKGWVKVEELDDLELEIEGDHQAPDSYSQDIETFLMTSEELERSTSPRSRGRREGS